MNRTQAAPRNAANTPALPARGEMGYFISEDAHSALDRLRLVAALLADSAPDAVGALAELTEDMVRDALASAVFGTAWLDAADLSLVEKGGAQ